MKFKKLIPKPSPKTTLLIVFSLLLASTLIPFRTLAQDQNQSSTFVYLSGEETQFFQMINQFRSKLNLPILKIHVYLQRAAVEHSAWMVNQDLTASPDYYLTHKTYLTHNGPDADESPFQRMEADGYVNYAIAGENLACGNPDPVKTFRQFAFSPEHLLNMLNPHFKHFGISRAGTGKEHCPYYWTTDFGSFDDPDQDPPAVTDLQQISQAITDVSGPLGKHVVKLTEDPASTTDTTAHPPQTASVPSPTGKILLSCNIPGSTAKGSLTYFQNTDVSVDLVKNGQNYDLNITYIVNGKPGTAPAFTLQNVSILKNNALPIYSIFSEPTEHQSGFIIQYNQQTGNAQYKPDSNSLPGPITGYSITCTSASS